MKRQYYPWKIFKAHHFTLSLSLQLPLSKYNSQNEVLENFQTSHFFSLSCSFKSNTPNQCLLFKVQFSLSLSLSLSLSPTHNCCFYFLIASLLSPTFSSNHRKSPSSLPVPTTSRYSLFVGSFLIIFSKWMDDSHLKGEKSPKLIIH